MDIKKVAIIVLHYKNLDDTRACLLSLQKLDYPNFSVLLVNNDSVEQGQKLRDEFGEFITLIQNDKNLGFADGNNIGINAALSDKEIDAVLILNNDTEVEPNFLSEMIKIKADMIVPRIMRSDKRDLVDNLGLTLMGSGLAFNRRTEKEKLFCPSGAAALYSRQLLEAISFNQTSYNKLSFPRKRESSLNDNGLDPCFRRDDKKGCETGEPLSRNDINYFDPAFFAYCEDLDLGFRARLAGFNVGYADKAIVYHKGSASTKPMSDFAVYHTYRNLIWTQFKNLPLTLLLWQSPWLAAGWIFLFALYTLKGKPGIIFSAFLDGLMGLRFMIKKRREILRSRTVSDKQILSWFATGLFPKTYLKK